MDGFSFIDIYSTKGIEYLVAVVFFVGFLALQYFLLRSAPGEMKTLPPGPGDRVKFHVPDGYCFHQGHSWMKRMEPAADDRRSLVRVGVNDFAQKLLGKVDGVKLPPVGSRIVQGKTGWSLQVDSAVIPMLSPVSGVVTALNEEVLRSPGILNSDPYTDGWLFQVESDRISRDTRHLLSGKVARTWMEHSLARLFPVQDEALGPVMQDGGLPVDGIAKALGGDRWEWLAMEHLLVNSEDFD
jgi:glycine cleavage system H protein